MTASTFAPRTMLTGIQGQGCPNNENSVVGVDLNVLRIDLVSQGKSDFAASSMPKDRSKAPLALRPSRRGAIRFTHSGKCFAPNAWVNMSKEPR
jgi:hypothetical protein